MLSLCLQGNYQLLIIDDLLDLFSAIRVIATSVLVVDIILVVVQLSLGERFPVFFEELLEILTLLFSAYFCVEVSLRIIGQGWVA